MSEWWKPCRLPLLPALAALLAGTCLLSAAATPARNDVIGIGSTWQTRQEDTLLDIAVDHDLGFIEIRAANPDVDPWLPGAGKLLVLPTQHVLPKAPRRGIVINLPELRLYYYPPIGEPRSFPIGLGGEGKETPVGPTRVLRNGAHPVWIPTRSEHDEDPDLPAQIGPGPDNPMGDYALYLGWSGYAIHGTNRPYSIGRRDSHGCIRMYPADIQLLYGLVTAGTPVTIVDQPIKVGWSAGELFLEIHWEQADAESLETTGRPRFAVEAAADDLVAAAAGPEVGRLNWYAIHLAEYRRTGVAVQVSMARDLPR